MPQTPLNVNISPLSRYPAWPACLAAGIKLFAVIVISVNYNTRLTTIKIPEIRKNGKAIAPEP